MYKGVVSLIKDCFMPLWLSSSSLLTNFPMSENCQRRLTYNNDEPTKRCL